LLKEKLGITLENELYMILLWRECWMAVCRLWRVYSVQL